MISQWIGSDRVGCVIDGQFPLLRWLGGSGETGVFLTRIGGGQGQTAAIKIIPANTVGAEALLAQWAASERLNHRNLISVFHAGSCRIDECDLLYAVTDYAEEVLSEILPERPLTAAEAGEMLDPVLDALSWLHAQGLVHGGLKPSNLLVVSEQLKLSVDRVQPAGAHIAPFPSAGIHDAPEAAARVSPASDVWSLGVLLVEALTQMPPQWDGRSAAGPAIPSSVLQPFAAIARECLQIDPARRCSVSEIRSRLAPHSAASPAVPLHASTSPMAQKAEAAPAAAKPAPVPPAPRRGALIAAAALVLVAAIVALMFAFRHSGPPISRAPVPQASAPAAQPSAPAASPAPPSGPAVPGAVLHRAMPDAPQDALHTIRGHIVVVVRVQVDGDGNVSSAQFKYAGNSHYFATLALNAARNWKFRPAQIGGRPVSSTWDLQFGFTQAGSEVKPVEVSP